MKFHQLPEDLQNEARAKLQVGSKEKSIRLSAKGVGTVIITAKHTKASHAHHTTEFEVRKAPAKK